MMEKKINIKDLEEQCLEAEKTFKALYDQLTKAKQEEEEAKQAKLKLEKDSRYKEVIDAYENFEELRTKYVEDYGSFTFNTSGFFGWWLNENI